MPKPHLKCKHFLKNPEEKAKKPTFPTLKWGIPIASPDDPAAFPVTPRVKRPRAQPPRAQNTTALRSQRAASRTPNPPQPSPKMRAIKNQIHWIPKSNPLDSKIKSIGFQNQIHWISKSNPLDSKIKSIGFQNQIHWISKSNPLDFANDLSGSVPPPSPFCDDTPSGSLWPNGEHWRRCYV